MMLFSHKQIIMVYVLGISQLHEHCHSLAGTDYSLARGAGVVSGEEER